MFTRKLFDLLSNPSKAPYGGFQAKHSQTSNALRSGELSFSGAQLLIYFGIALATTGLLTWAGVHYLVFAP